MAIESITAVLTALNQTKLLLESVRGVRDFNQCATTVAGALDKLIEAQQGLLAQQAVAAGLQDELFQAKGELREARERLDQRERYALVELSKGVFVCRLKQRKQTHVLGEADLEPPHDVCQRCLNRGIKSVLQRSVGAGQVTLDCLECSVSLPTGETVSSRLHAPDLGLA